MHGEHLCHCEHANVNANTQLFVKCKARDFLRALLTPKEVKILDFDQIVFWLLLFFIHFFG